MDSHMKDVLCGQTWCPLCYATKRRREDHPGHGASRRSRAERRRACMSFLRKVEEPVHMDGGGRSACGGSWDSLFPALLEFLAATKWSDGTSRTPGSMTLFADCGTWKLCLSDKHQQRIAFVSAKEPQAALEAAERGLMSDSLDWRAMRQNQFPGRKK
jgi:hypothetical protein